MGVHITCRGLFLSSHGTPANFFRVTFSVRETRQNKAPLHCMKSLRYRCFILWPRSSERRIGDQKVCKPPCRDGKPDKGNAKARCTEQGNGQANGKVYHICNEERAHDAKPAQHAISRHLEDRKSTRLNSSHANESRMPSSA